MNKPDTTKQKPDLLSHRSKVGPVDLFDLVGAQQFQVALSLGLREYHLLLDLGCGCLRGGRFFITYLHPYCYTGVEPDKKLVEAGVKHEIGYDLTVKKAARFIYDADNYGEVLKGYKFNFIMAQSIFSHCGPAMMREHLRKLSELMKPDSVLMATYIRGGLDSYNHQGWHGAHPVRYTEMSMVNYLKDAGLTYERLPFDHPNNQRWFCSRLR